MKKELHRNGAISTSQHWPHCFKDGNSIRSNVPRRSEAQPTNQPCTEVTENVTIKIGHDKYIKLGGVLYQLQKRR